MGKTIDVLMHYDEDGGDESAEMIFDLYEATDGGSQFGFVKKSAHGVWEIKLLPKKGGGSWSFELNEFLEAARVIQEKLKAIENK